MDIIKGIAEKRLKPRHEEDFIDRANYVSTPFILSIAAILSFAKEYGPWSQPLYCWANAEWNDQWLEYAHDYCFVESTYYVPMNQSIPLQGQRNNSQDQVSYYQWLPFILFLMALTCQMPHHFWRICNALSGKSLPTIIRQAHDAMGKSNEGKVAAGIGRHLFTTLGQESNQGRAFCWRAVNWPIQYLSRHMLCLFYVCMKLFFFLINIGQLAFITHFLGAQQTPNWGLQMLDAFFKYGTAWEQNGLFPRVSLCDFTIRAPGENFSKYTLQCVLMANFLNEKIFMTLYYLFAFMAAITVLNLFCWCWRLLYPASGYIGKMVELSAIQIHPDPEMPKPVGGMDRWEEEEFVDSDDALEKSIISSISSSSSFSSSATSSSHSYHRHDRVSPAISNATTNTCISTSSTVPIVTQMANNQEMAQIHQQNHQEGRPSPNGTSPAISMTVQEKQEQEWEKKMVVAMEKRRIFCLKYRKYEDEFLEMLGSDGILIVHLIRVNAGSQMASLIIGEMFNAFFMAKYAAGMPGNAGKSICEGPLKV